MTVIKEGNRVRVRPDDWEHKKSAAVGRMENGILVKPSSQVMGILKAVGISVEAIDQAEQLGFHTVRFNAKDSAGNVFVGDVPVTEVRKCEKERFNDWPEQYFVPLDQLTVVGKKPAGTEGAEGAEKQA
jgi:hypothetical protein